MLHMLLILKDDAYLGTCIIPLYAPAAQQQQQSTSRDPSTDVSIAFGLKTLQAPLQRR